MLTYTLMVGSQVLTDHGLHGVPAQTTVRQFLILAAENDVVGLVLSVIISTLMADLELPADLVPEPERLLGSCSATLEPIDRSCVISGQRTSQQELLGRAEGLLVRPTLLLLLDLPTTFAGFIQVPGPPTTL